MLKVSQGLLVTSVGANGHSPLLTSVRRQSDGSPMRVALSVGQDSY
ncbi:MAG: hypothetical protein F6K24_42925 [Okeania sp. SIO2D1]|nr:hypothetical protein [Okeania sp. SIO2C9]NEQ73909.1 hypothetical protein [Okeania sp. SIO2C9]NES71479.1 hypothetical protein [Okeania sp. SIO2D1]